MLLKEARDKFSSKKYSFNNYIIAKVFCVLLQVFAFVAPKIIGGVNAPSPVGELGMVQMSQALDLIDVSYEQATLNAHCRLILFTKCAI